MYSANRPPTTGLAIAVVLAAAAASVPATSAGNLRISQAERPPDRVAWLRENLIPIRTVEPSDKDFADLMPLRGLIGSARVVQLGENSHGDGTTFLAKARLIRFLHQVLGFDAIAWEAGLYDMRDVAAALAGDRPTADAGSLGLYRLWWGAAEIQPTLEYIRESQRGPAPLRLVGFDSRVSTLEARTERFPAFVFDFFDRLDPSLISPAERSALREMSAGLVPVDYYEAPGPRDWDRALLHRLVGVLDARVSELASHHSPRAIAYARQALVSLLNMDRALARIQEPPLTDQGYSRDTAMAENLLWWLDGELRDRKVIVWAHNYHVQEGLMADAPRADLPLMGPTGRFLAERLGEDLYTVGFLSWAGAMGYVDADPEPLPPFGPDSLEALLHAAGHPLAWLDLHRMSGGGWLHEPIPASFSIYDVPAAAVSWPRLYDAVLFIDEQRPATPLPVPPAR